MRTNIQTSPAFTTVCVTVENEKWRGKKKKQTNVAAKKQQQQHSIVCASQKAYNTRQAERRLNAKRKIYEPMQNIKANIHKTKDEKKKKTQNLHATRRKKNEARKNNNNEKLWRKKKNYFTKKSTHNKRMNNTHLSVVEWAHRKCVLFNFDHE